MLVNPSDLVAKAKATITECSVSDAHGCIASDTLLIDIREPAEYTRGHIPGALHLPRGPKARFAGREECPAVDLAVLRAPGGLGRAAGALADLRQMKPDQCE